jgi:ABC-type transport system substrate-binding protein
METLFMGNYTTPPSIWDFSTSWIPPQFATGCLVDNYSMPNPYTVICVIRNNVSWQNIAPSFGRQLVASDVVAHYNRMLGLGGGYTTIDPYYVGNGSWSPLLSVVASDQSGTTAGTVTFNWKQGTSPISILTVMQAAGADNSINNPDAVTAYTTSSQPILSNWHNAIGSGPFILTDFVDGSSITYVANPNYWGKDQRWPQNKLPYISNYKMLIIPNAPTAEAGMRVGKLDSYALMPVNDALNMMKTNPEIVVKQLPQTNQCELGLNNSLAPFNNINVRVAIQHAINIPLIASSYFQGYATPWPESLTENQMGFGGWGDPYPNWPDSTKALYTFDPTLSKQMLAAAGFNTNITYPFILESDADQGLYQIVQAQLQAVGIQTSATVLIPAAWVSQIITSHNYTAFAARTPGLLGVSYDPFHQMVKLTWGYTQDWIMVNDPVINNNYQQALVAQSVSDVQKLLVADNDYIASQVFTICVAQPSAFNMVQPWIQGDPGNNTLGDAVTGASFGGYVPLGDWINPALK